MQDPGNQAAQEREHEEENPPLTAISSAPLGHLPASDRDNIPPCSLIVSGVLAGKGHLGLASIRDRAASGDRSYCAETGAKANSEGKATLVRRRDIAVRLA
jgi:hypothetical protein